MSNFYDYLTKQIAGNRSSRILIEAFGTPGVGKSFICSNLHDSFSATKNNFFYHSIDNYSSNFIIRFFYKGFFILKTLLFELKIIRANIVILNSFGNLKALAKCKLILNLLLVSSLVVRNRKRNLPLLADQGFFQSIWSLYYYNNEIIEPDIQKKLINSVCSLLEVLYLDKLIILHVRADNSVIKSRLSSRDIKGSSPLNSLEKDYIRKGFDATSFSRRIIEEAIKKSDKIYLFDINN